LPRLRAAKTSLASRRIFGTIGPSQAESCRRSRKAALSDSSMVPSMGGLSVADATAPAARSSRLRELVASTPRTTASTVPRCRVRVAATDTGIGTILTGLAQLAREGRIELAMDVRPEESPLTDGPWHLRDKASGLVELFVDERRSALIDVHDSWEIDAHALATHDLYFKRSLRPLSPRLPHAQRLRALGLVDDVRADGFDRYEAQRILLAHAPRAARTRAFVRFLGSTLLAAAGRGNRPVLARMHAPPRFDQAPRALFMTALWDPGLVPAWAPQKRAEFEAINQTRVAVLRALRRAFGPRFHGGLRHSDYTRRHYPELLLPSAAAGSPREFIRHVHEHPVCVTTTGLHDSTGWKLAEYLALSRAIACEPPLYAVPGELAAGRHYLEFRDPDACVAAVGRLLQDADERHAMMQRNWQYWQQWLRPDRLAWRIVEETRGA
jgi:hypothetical protein